MWLILSFAALILLLIIAGSLVVRWGQAQNVVTGLRWGLTSLNTYARVFRHALVVAIVLTVLMAAKSYSVGVAEKKAGDWLTSYNGVMTTTVVGPIQADQAPPLAAASPTPSPSPTFSPTPLEENAESQKVVLASSTSPLPTPTPTPTAVEQKRLDEQLRTIRDRIKHHGDVMAFFYVNYFVAIVMVMIGGLLVAVTLFMIAQKGWTGTCSYVEAVFIVASMWVAFYGLFPPVFQQEKNIVDNKVLFLKYKRLEAELESYPVTHVTLKGDEKLPRQFINYIDSEMQAIGDIALGFDVNKINYQDAITLTKPSPVNPPAARSPAPSPGGK